MVKRYHRLRKKIWCLVLDRKTSDAWRRELTVFQKRLKLEEWINDEKYFLSGSNELVVFVDDRYGSGRGFCISYVVDGELIDVLGSALI